MQKLKELAKKAGKFAAGLIAGFTFIATVYISGRRKGCTETKKENKAVTKANDVKKLKEIEIEETQARTLVTDSSEYEAHQRRKTELKKQYGDKADAVAEAFFRG